MDVKLIEGDMVQFDETITKTENQRPWQHNEGEGYQ
jgi:hypothetical protein